LDLHPKPIGDYAKRGVKAAGKSRTQHVARVRQIMVTADGPMNAKVPCRSMRLARHHRAVEDVGGAIAVGSGAIGDAGVGGAVMRAKRILALLDYAG
jgi:hypothetical protein